MLNLANGNASLYQHPLDMRAELVEEAAVGATKDLLGGELTGLCHLHTAQHTRSVWQALIGQWSSSPGVDRG